MDPYALVGVAFLSLLLIGAPASAQQPLNPYEAYTDGDFEGALTAIEAAFAGEEVPDEAPNYIEVAEQILRLRTDLPLSRLVPIYQRSVESASLDIWFRWRFEARLSAIEEIGDDAGLSLTESLGQAEELDGLPESGLDVNHDREGRAEIYSLACARQARRHAAEMTWSYLTGYFAFIADPYQGRDEFVAFLLSDGGSDLHRGHALKMLSRILDNTYPGGIPDIEAALIERLAAGN